jgi:hypothetical protein
MQKHSWKTLRRSSTRKKTWNLKTTSFVLGLLVISAFAAPVIIGGKTRPGNPTLVSAPASTEIASQNLVCAKGLPGAEGLDIASCLRTLDAWAERVRSETDRHLYRFRNNPAEYGYSEGYFRMLMVAVILYEDFGVRYNPARISSPNAPGDWGFFADSRDLFLHGLLGPTRTGTCSSMPVLYAAIGRRLGYPLKLVTTKAHVFLRWDDGTERFNLEATGRGMNRYDDDHFRRWPYPVTPQEEAQDGYLRSLGPEEEQALFLSLRAQCLFVNGRRTEALQSLEQAVQTAPGSRPFRMLLAAMKASEQPVVMGMTPDTSLLPPELLPWANQPPTPNPVLEPNPLLQIR